MKDPYPEGSNKQRCVLRRLCLQRPSSSNLPDILGFELDPGDRSYCTRPWPHLARDFHETQWSETGCPKEPNRRTRLDVSAELSDYMLADGGVQMIDYWICLAMGLVMSYAMFISVAWGQSPDLLHSRIHHVDFDAIRFSCMRKYAK